MNLQHQPLVKAFRQAAIGRCIEFLQAITAQLLALKNQQFLQGGAWEFYGRICPIKGTSGGPKIRVSMGFPRKYLGGFKKKQYNYGPVDFDPLQEWIILFTVYLYINAAIHYSIG